MWHWHLHVYCTIAACVGCALSLGPMYAPSIIGSLWCLHGAFDLLHHHSACCTPAARRMYGLAELHKRFAWEPLTCLGFDLAMGLGCAALAVSPEVS